MKIELKEILIKDITNGYSDNSEEGVVAYGGKLNIRPPYQREFVYKDDKRDAVIKTINKGFPLNVMYWVVNNDGTFEVLDGQQRTISFCNYVHNGFSISKDGYSFGFDNLTKDEKEKILNYKLMVYFCEGTDKEKLDWFKTINIAGEKLTNQELRNAMYTGTWLHDAKRHFSKTGCPAHQIGSNYLKGSAIRQDYLEKALEWISNKDGLKNIEDYMAKHQHDKDANELWMYFQNVINWVRTVFPIYRKEMCGLEWGILYNKFKDTNYNSSDLEEKIKELMMDDEITKKSGIYLYLLSGDKKHLNLRTFTPAQKRKKYEEQKGICPYCAAEGIDKVWSIDEMEADHKTPWSEGGKTDLDNCQMLCKRHNREKSNK